MGWSVRVPRRVHDMAGPLREAEETLGQDLGRNPTDGEIADLLGCDPAEVDAIRAGAHVRSVASLDRAHVSHDGSQHSLTDGHGTHDRAIEEVERRVAAEQLVARLEPDDRELIGLYYQDGLTQAQIAARLGVSQMQVCRLLERTLNRLRSHLPDPI